MLNRTLVMYKKETEGKVRERERWEERERSCRDKTVLQGENCVKREDVEWNFSHVQQRKGGKERERGMERKKEKRQSLYYKERTAKRENGE